MLLKIVLTMSLPNPATEPEDVAEDAPDRKVRECAARAAAVTSAGRGDGREQERERSRSGQRHGGEPCATDPAAAREGAHQATSPGMQTSAMMPNPTRIACE